MITKSALLVDYKSAANVTTSGARAISADIPVGSLAVLTAMGSGATGTTVGISDTQSQTWTQLSQVINGAVGGGWVTMAYAPITAALVAGTDTITVTRASGSLLFQVRYLLGVDLNNPLDGSQGTGSNATTNSAVTVSAAMAVAAGSFIFAAAMMGGTTTISSPASGFTKESDGSSTVSNIRSYGTIYEAALGAAGSVTPAFTASANNLWAISAQAFREALTPRPRLAQQAVSRASTF